MKREERLGRYAKGESISSIAKAAGVSRQSMTECLVRAGVHDPGKVGVQVVEEEKVPQADAREPLAPSRATPKAVLIPKDCPIDIAKIPPHEKSLIKLGGGREIQVGRNLYLRKDGYLVKYWSKGSMVERKFPTLAALVFEYGK